MGIFAGSGVGKSTLLGMIARGAESEVNVIALIGERGRELREFIEKDLGPEGMARSVIIVSTSDQPALVRIRGALLATTIAESFRDEGRKVLFMLLGFFGVVFGVNFLMMKLAIDTLPGTEVDSAYSASLAYEQDIVAARSGGSTEQHVARCREVQGPAAAEQLRVGCRADRERAAAIGGDGVGSAGDGLGLRLPADHR